MIVQRLLVMLLSAFMATSAVGWTVDLSGLKVVPSPRLGLAFPGSKTQNYKAISGAGIGIARISASWGRIQQSKGHFDWSGFDRRIVALQEAGVEPFVTFESDADWATVPESHSVKNARPKDLAQWARFVGLLVERYDGDGRKDAPGLKRPVRYWQVANEWMGEKSRSGGWVGNADQLIAFIKETERAVKGADSNSIFVLGGIAAFNMDILLVARGGSEFTVRQRWNPSSETVLSVADMRGREIASLIDNFIMPVLLQSPYDIADVHLYGPENRDAARIDFFRRLTGRPVISAECGGPSLDYGGKYSPEGHFLAVIKRNLGVLAADAEFCLWFRLSEGEGTTFGNKRTGLYSANGEPKPGVFAYRLLARLLRDGAEVRQRGDEAYSVKTSASGPVTLGWGSSAHEIRAEASQNGYDVLCLKSAPKGHLTSDLKDCATDSFVLSGRSLTKLFEK